jgi:hypothetical protein
VQMWRFRDTLPHLGRVVLAASGASIERRWAISVRTPSPANPRAHRT